MRAVDPCHGGYLLAIPFVPEVVVGATFPISVSFRICGGQEE
jgi:hypothetical protein